MHMIKKFQKLIAEMCKKLVLSISNLFYASSNISRISKYSERGASYCYLQFDNMTAVAACSCHCREEEIWPVSSPYFSQIDSSQILLEAWKLRTNLAYKKLNNCQYSKLKSKEPLTGLPPPPFSPSPSLPKDHPLDTYCNCIFFLAGN